MKFITEQRTVIVGVKPIEEGDEHEYNDGVIHAHVSFESRDCDGTYHGSHDIWPHKLHPNGQPMDLNDDYLDFRFIDYVIADCVNWTGMAGGGGMRVWDNSQGDSPEGTWLTLHWEAPTEEGHCGRFARICRNPYCEPEDATQRDHTAEAAGY